MAKPDVDVVVIGAGFAGLTAARELKRQGASVSIVEARDRVGGRTWLDHRLGRDLEIGGTWVHWTQPYVWAELNRYGLETTPSPEPQRAMWWADGALRQGEPGDLLDLIGKTNEVFVRASREYFPEPFRPLSQGDLQEIDDVSVLERIRTQFPPGSERDVLESFWALNFNGPLQNAAFTQALRWVALTNGDWAVCFEACATYKIVGGTKALADAILADSSVTVEYNFVVSSVREEDGVVAVVSNDGRAVTASAVIVTIPMAVMSGVEFSPELSAAKHAAIGAGQVSKGTKVWIRLRGRHKPFAALGGADWPLNFFQSEYEIDGDTIIVGFGPDARLIDSQDTAAVQEQLRRLLPDADVVEVATHDWVGDKFAGETWPMHRTGFLSRHLEAMQAPHGRVLFAGSDMANGWGGFIDGAIESGMTAAREAYNVVTAPDELAGVSGSVSPAEAV